MRNRISFFTFALTVVAAVAGCRDAAGPQRSLGSAAGIYLLATVNGQAPPTSDAAAPIGGSLYLWPTGHVERHVEYRRHDGGTETIELAGSFHFEGDALVLDLRPKDQYAPSVWRVTGTLEGTKLTIGYPGAADAWIREEHRRQ